MARKKIIILIFLMAFLPLIGFGCKGISQEQQIAIKPVSLNYWTVFDDVEVLQDLAKEYSQIRPYVRVNIKQVRYEEFDKLFINALADDVPPDIVSVQARNLPHYLNKLSPMPESVEVAKITVSGQYFQETVVSTEKLVMPNLRYVQSQYVGTVAKDAIKENKIYGLPLALDTMAIYYNKDLLDKVGIPSPPANWEEFMAAVKKSVRLDSEGNILQSGVALGTGKNIPRVFDILSLLVMQGGLNLDKGYVSWASGLNSNSFDNQPVVKALNFYTDFARPNKEVYSWNKKEKEALDSFARGKSVFYFGFAYDYEQIKAKAPQLNVEVIPMFQLNPENPVNVADYWLESVVQKSQHKNEAWDFVRFITTPDNVKKYTTATHRPSPLRAQIAEQKEDVFLSPFVAYILNAKNWYQGQDYSLASQAAADLADSYVEPYEGTKEKENKMGLISAFSKKVEQTL